MPMIARSIALIAALVNLQVLAKGLVMPVRRAKKKEIQPALPVWPVDTVPRQPATIVPIVRLECSNPKLGCRIVCHACPEVIITKREQHNARNAATGIINRWPVIHRVYLVKLANTWTRRVKPLAYPVFRAHIKT